MTDANLSEIMNNISNINTTFTLNTSDIVNNAIETSNTQTDGWIGLIVLGIFTFAILIHLLKNRQEFRIGGEIPFILFGLNIILDIAFFLYQYRILYNIQPAIFLFTLFFALCIFSLLRKETNTYN